MLDVKLTPEVFGALWATRQGEEASEDDILRRILKLPGRKLRDEPAKKMAVAAKPNMSGGIGWTDDRFAVSVPNGFRIYRRVKKLPREARAEGGLWHLLPVHGVFGQDKPGGTFATLNELSHAAGAGVENAWRNWFYFDDVTQKRCPISDLRDPERITPRK